MVYIKEGKEKSLLRHHPWVFTGAIDSVDSAESICEFGEVKTGSAQDRSDNSSTAENSDCSDNKTGIQKVVDKKGAFIAWGYYDESSHVVLRLLSWNKADIIDDLWWKNKVKESIERRSPLFAKKDTDSFRLVHGEADFLPGLVVDLYGKVVRVIISARVSFFNRDSIVSAVQEKLNPELIILNTDPSFCGLEKIKELIEYYRNGERFYPDKSLEPIEIRESGIYYAFIPGTGQKSGFFCDQRENRNVFERYVAEFSDKAGFADKTGTADKASIADKSGFADKTGIADKAVIADKAGPTVLDACCYTGAFTLHALRAGAGHIDSVDVSDTALDLLVRNIKLNVQNGVLPEDSISRVTTEKADVFTKLRNIPEDKYDFIVLDPPKLAKTQKNLEEAKKGYKDLNRLAMRKIKNNGILLTCSCSGALNWEDFRMVTGWAAKDAGVEVQVLEQLSQRDDHPVRLSFPESEYLKVMVLRVIKD